MTIGLTIVLFIFLIILVIYSIYEVFNGIDKFKKVYPSKKNIKIQNMNVNEYNNYLYKAHIDEAIESCEKIKNIIYWAYDDYIKDCKEREKYIEDEFYIHAWKNKFGISGQDIINFKKCYKKMKFGKFIIEGGKTDLQFPKTWSILNVTDSHPQEFLYIKIIKEDL